MKILKLVDIHKLYVAIYMFKILRMDLCPTLLSSLDINTASHMYSTRHRDDLILPFPRVETLRINFKYQYVSIWNSVPENIKACGSLTRFKSLLIEYFLSQY